MALPDTTPISLSWDEAYSKYGDALRSGDISVNTINNLYGGLSPDFSSNIIRIKNEIDAQKKSGTADYWGAGNLASPDAAAWDAAFRLAEKGVGSLYDLKQVDGQTVNAKTGQPLEGFGNAYNYDLDYNLNFNPEGVPVLTASNQASEWVDKYRTPLTAAALAALTYGALSGAEGSLFAGTGGMTAEQLAAANALGGAEVAGGLTAAEAAAAGLGGGVSATTAGLLSGLTAEQLAAMDALGGAEVAGGLTASEAAAAGLGGGFPAAAASGVLSNLTPSQIANLVKAGVSLTGIAGAAGLAQPNQETRPLQTPTQTAPTYTPDYYQQLQQYYNSYLPQTPRDVVSPLQQWYSQTYNGGTVQQPQQQLGAATGMMQPAPVTPQTATGNTQATSMVAQPTTVTQAGPVSVGGLFTAGGGGSGASFMSPASDKAYIDWMLTQPNPLGQGTVADVYKAQGVDPYTDPRVVSQAREQNERAGRRVDMYGGVAGAPMEQIAPWQNPNWQAQQAAAQQALAERQRVQAAQDAASGVTVGGGVVAPDVNQWAQTEQGQAAGGINSVYNSINTFLAGNPSQEALQAAMRDFGVTPETLEAARAYSANNPQ